jgi:hypothetical protein
MSSPAPPTPESEPVVLNMPGRYLALAAQSFALLLMFGSIAFTSGAILFATFSEPEAVPQIIYVSLRVAGLIFIFLPLALVLSLWTSPVRLPAPDMPETET